MATAGSNEKELSGGEKKEGEVLPLEHIIKKVKGITKSGSKAFKYAFEEQLDVVDLDVVDLTSEDCARDKASIWG